jgi:hypothetical protein
VFHPYSLTHARVSVLQRFAGRLPFFLLVCWGSFLLLLCFEKESLADMTGHINFCKWCVGGTYESTAVGVFLDIHMGTSSEVVSTDRPALWEMADSFTALIFVLFA